MRYAGVKELKQKTMDILKEADKGDIIITAYGKPAAVRDVEGLEPSGSIQLVRDIQAYLETRPVPFGRSWIKKLAGFDPPLYRLRIGDFRAYYRICGDEAVVLEEKTS